MAEGKGQRKWPIPAGFTFDFNSALYKHPNGCTWDSQTGEVRDPNGMLVWTTPPGVVESSGPTLGVDSTSDARTINNDNVMRHNYRVLSDAEKVAMTMFKDLGVEFVKACDSIGSSRELSLAKTKMEEAVMWAVKHVTK